MNEILNYILKIVIAFAVIIITKYVVPYLKAQIEDSQYAWLVEVVIDGVRFAEQTISGPKTGAEKKALVTELLTKLAKDKGIAVTEEQISALIESAVYAMKQENNETK